MSSVCEESSTMLQFTPSGIWKCHVVLFDIYVRSSNVKISECLGINLRTLLMIRKELDEGTTVRKPHSDRSDKKSSLEIVGDIPAMTDNDPSKSIRSIVKDLRVSEFLIRWVVQEDIR